MTHTSSQIPKPTSRYLIPHASLRHLFADSVVLSSAIVFAITGLHAVFPFLIMAWVYKLAIAAAHFRTAVGLAFVNFGIVFWYVYPSAISMTDADYQLGPQFAFLHFTLAALAMLTTLTDMLWAKLTPKNAFFVSTTPEQFRLTATIFAVLGVVWVVAHAPSLNSFLDALLTGRGASDKMWRRGDTNFSSSLNDSVSLLFNAFLVAATIMYSFLVFQRNNPIRRLATLMIYLGLLVFCVIDSGTRFVLAIATLPAFITWMYGTYLSTAKLATFAMLFVGLVVGSQFLMHGRHYGYGHVDASEISREVATLGGTIDYFRETESAMKWFEPGEYPESNLLIFATILIPRSIYPDKPFSRVAEQFTYKAWGLNILTSGGNKFPGVVGQYFISSGWMLFLAIPMFWGFFSSAVSNGLRLGLRKNEALSIALPVAYGVWLLFSFRFVSPGQLLPIFFFHITLIATKHMRRVLQ